MAANRHPYRSREPRKDLLSEVLDFGPDTDVNDPNPDFSHRVQKIVKKLQEISQRIDKLSESAD